MELGKYRINYSVQATWQTLYSTTNLLWVQDTQNSGWDILLLQKSFCLVKGRENGVLYAKYATGEGSLCRHQNFVYIRDKSCMLGDQKKFGTCCPRYNVTFNLKVTEESWSPSKEGGNPVGHKVSLRRWRTLGLWQAITEASRCCDTLGTLSSHLATTRRGATRQRPVFPPENLFLHNAEISFSGTPQVQVQTNNLYDSYMLTSTQRKTSSLETKCLF